MTTTHADTWTLDFTRADRSDDPFGFRFAPQRYLLRSDGGAVASATFAWDQALLADLARVSRDGDAEAAARVGEALRRFLVEGGWERDEERLYAAIREGRPVILTVRSNAAELYVLPWELLTLESTGQHLGEAPALGIRYVWPDTVTAPPPIDPPPEGGRILFAWAAAGGAVPAAEHRQVIQGSCSKGHVLFDMKDEIAEASLAAIDRALRAPAGGRPPIVGLHLLCRWGAVDGRAGLLLDGGGAPIAVDADGLRQALAPHAGALRLVHLMVCDDGGGGAQAQLGGVAQALHRAGVQAVLATRMPLAPAATIVATRALFDALFVDLKSVQGASLAVRRALHVEAPGFAWASLQLHARPEDGDDARPLVIRPLRGLAAIDGGGGRTFRGRDREVQQTIAALESLARAGAPRVLALTGPSAVGKSSLAVAGVGYRLSQRTEDPWTVVAGGVGAAGAVDVALTRGAGRVLVIVDPLVGPSTDPSVAPALARMVALASAADGRVSALFTLRSADLGGVDGELGALLRRPGHRLEVAPMGAEQLREAIEGSMGAVGLRLEAGLGARMIADAGAGIGALSALAHAADLLWARRRGPLVTQAAYDAIGGVTGAFAAHADIVVDRLDDKERALAKRVIRSLVPGSALTPRRPVALASIRPTTADAAAPFDRGIARLVDARLLIVLEVDGAAAIEVAHEPLLRRWERLLRWIREDQEELAALADLDRWADEHRRFGALLAGDRLAFARSIVDRRPGEVADAALALIAASEAAIRQEEAARSRGPRILVLAVIVTAIVAFGLGHL